MTAAGLIQRSIYGGVLILAILTVRAVLLYRLPKRTFPILWAVALARLLLPFSFSSVFSVYSLLQPKAATEASAYLPYGTGEGAISAAAWTAVQNTGETILSAAGENRFPVLPAIWGIGAALCAIFFVRAYFRSLRDFRNAVPVDNNRIRQWLSTHRTGNPISVRQSDKIAAPLTYGILHPVILLPRRLLEENTPELEYVLQHEYVHIRHHDAALKLAMVAALCIHWFNPLVWVMCGLLNRDIELACDEGVLRRFGEQSRAGYAMALIGMEEKKRSLLPLYNGFSKNSTEERIVLIMKYKKMKRVTCVAALLLVLSVALIFSTSARTSEAADTDAGSLTANVSGTDTSYLSGAAPADPGADLVNMSETDMADEQGTGTANGQRTGTADRQGNTANGQGTDTADGPGTGTADGPDMVNVPMDPPADSMFYKDSTPAQSGQPIAPKAATEEPVSNAATGSGAYMLSYMQEGILTEIPAALYSGDGYYILIPSEGWRLYAPDAWMWTANEKVQLWISDCSGSTWAQEQNRLEADGYSRTEENNIYSKESDGRIFFAEIRKSDNSMMCINYTYPSDPEYIEGFHTQLRAITDSFSLVPAEVDNSLSESGKQLQQLAMAFWEAYLGGNTRNIRQYLSADFDSEIDVFPDGIDGHVASEASLQAVKGLDISDMAAGETCDISLEFRPAAGTDYLEYLTVTAVMDGDEWKVLSYGLEM